mmetsp:Transcript_5329/g.9677  ORF Transcript_5329/g.9677 Transcript_5329/m.9677 type:complete len:252 (-) Transcript_5329:112-867(-)
MLIRICRSNTSETMEKDRECSRDSSRVHRLDNNLDNLSLDITNLELRGSNLGEWEDNHPSQMINGITMVNKPRDICKVQSSNNNAVKCRNSSKVVRRKNNPRTEKRNRTRLCRNNNSVNPRCRANRAKCLVSKCHLLDGLRRAMKDLRVDSNSNNKRKSKRVSRCRCNLTNNRVHRDGSASSLLLTNNVNPRSSSSSSCSNNNQNNNNNSKFTSPMSNMPWDTPRRPLVTLEDRHGKFLTLVPILALMAMW